MKDIIIDISKDFKFSVDIKNELTEFLDKYNISFPPEGDEYYDLHKTYIFIDELDIRYLLNNIDGLAVLAFRTPGATRGGIHIKEVNRNKSKESNITSIEYEIVDITFNASTCFRVFKTYRREVIKASKNELIGTKFIINIDR